MRKNLLTIFILIFHVSSIYPQKHQKQENNIQSYSQTPLINLWSPLAGQKKRISSYKQTGENGDYIVIPADERSVLMHLRDVSGCIQRIWMTTNSQDPDYLKKIKIRMIFDGESTVNDIPLGMFVGTGPWKVNDLTTPVLNIMRSRKGNKDQIGIGNGSLNIHWIMPFTNEAKIEMYNGTNDEIKQFFYIDYIEIKHPTPPLLFRAHYNINSPTTTTDNKITIDVSSNYVFLDIKGYKGRYVGTILCVESHPDRIGKWYEGDDMFVIDGEPWPPRLHGSGTEDYFGMAWGVHRPYQAFDHGVSHFEKKITDHDRYFDGRYVLYRWHLNDPIIFYKSLHASIEAGHANECEQHYESVSFWYGLKTE